MTKCGRVADNHFDYAPESIRKSVMNSLTRLQTDYLDTVYLHDVEFVCDSVASKVQGNHATALHEDASLYGLASGDEAVVRGPGDQKVLDAFAELLKLKEEGLVHNIGITGMYHC
jgi:D-arabinose 1-dehydrogenase